MAPPASPTAVGGGRSEAAAADDDDSDDEVEELSETEFKRRTLRLVRTDVGVRTFGSRTGLFAYAEIAKCRFVGFYFGTWLSEPDYLALLERGTGAPAAALRQVRAPEQPNASRRGHRAPGVHPRDCQERRRARLRRPLQAL